MHRSKSTLINAWLYFLLLFCQDYTEIWKILLLHREGVCCGEMQMVCLTDFEEYAKEHLSKATWDYYAAGADECCTRDDNLLAYKRYSEQNKVDPDIQGYCTSKMHVFPWWFFFFYNVCQTIYLKAAQRRNIFLTFIVITDMQAALQWCSFNTLKK